MAQAFSKLKQKVFPRSSIEALLKRVHQGRGIYPINLVDLYNSVSMAYALRGEDGINWWVASLVKKEANLSFH